MGDRVWTNAIKKPRPPKPSETAKRAIIAACEAFNPAG